MIGKTDVVICEVCRFPCEEEVYFGGHGSIGKAVPLSFCSQECLEDHTGVMELVAQEVEERVRSEFNLIHGSVCPSCVRRLRKLI